MERQWIIQRCINAVRNDYEDWSGYCERLMTRDEMLKALAGCEEKWPNYEFRGHNVINQKPGSDRPRPVGACGQKTANSPTSLARSTTP